MRLFDVATVVENGGHWTSESDSRECLVRVSAGEVCGDVNPTLQVTTGQGDGSTYRFLPFAIEARLTRNIWCAQEDDPDWLSKSLRDASERAILLALITEPYTDAEAGFWNAIPMSTGAGDATTVEAKMVGLREAWAAQFVPKKGEYPILYGSAYDLKALSDHKLIDIDGDEITTIWGDPFVLLPEAEAGTLYISGPLKVYLSPVSEAEGYEIRGNRVEYHAYRLAAIDVAPCSIGTYGVVEEPEPEPEPEPDEEP